MTESSVSGKIWILSDDKGGLIENIDTDQIFHNAHLHITEMEKMGEYALGNLEGWKDFPQRSSPGNILVVGPNAGNIDVLLLGVDEESPVEKPVAQSPIVQTLLSGQLNIPTGINYRIFDAAGRRVEDHQLEPGVYFLEIDGKIARKIIKVK